MTKSVTAETRHRRALTRVCALAGTLAAGTALAQSSADGVLEEVVVTATKRSEKIVDVPIAVSAISAADIQARGLAQFADYLSSVPGVYYEDGGPGRSQIRLRGIVAEDVPGSATVATYFGETVTSVLTPPNLRLVDIDRVEVLRGPQGTLFGANSLTGVVRVVPAAPDLHSFDVQLGTREFATAHSGDPSYHVEGTVNIPVLEDRVGLRLVAYKDKTAGFIDNIVPARGPFDYSFLADALLGLPDGTTPPGTLVIPGNPAFARKDINSEDTWGARAALSWRATDRLRFDLNYATQQVKLHSEPQVQPAAGPYAQDREVDLYDQGRLFEHVNIGSLVAHYDWDAVSLLSATSTMNMSRGRVIDESFFAQGALGVALPWTLHDDSQGRVFTEELRLQSNGRRALQWTLGAFYLYQDANASQFLPDFSCPTCLPTLVLGQDFQLRPAPNFDSKVLRQRQRSLFGEVSYTLSRWTLGVGARYLEDSIETVTGAYEGFIVNGFLPATPPISGTNYEFNPSGYVRFKVADDVMLYLQAARGFRSGQVNQVLAYTGPCAQESASIGLGPLTKPDTLWNHELGLKSRFMDGRINVNVALYQQKWNGVQLGTSLACGFNGTINAGDVKGKGAELEITAQLLRGLKLNLSASYNHNEFDSVLPATGFTKGERVPDAPEENAGVGLQYDFPVNNTWSGFARADYTFVGDVQYKFGQGDSAVIIKQPSYGSANLRLGLRRSDLAIELFARNFTDRRAAVFTADPELGNYQYLLRPREVGGEIRYAFKPAR